MLEEYRAPAVICAIPIFEAVSNNILGRRFLTKDWAEVVKQYEMLAIYDLSGFYLLRKDVVPRDGLGYFHFNVDGVADENRAAELPFDNLAEGQDSTLDQSRSSC